MSAESGVPTFRGLDGLWRNYNPLELATPAAFAANPTLVWEWYDWRRSLVAATRPHAGHLALAQLELLGHQVTVITQNVDGLHHRAGSRHVIEIHGSLWRMICTGCQRLELNRQPRLRTLPPLCTDCGQMLRPGVVWFGENLPPLAWEASLEATREAALLLVIGASGTVYPAADLVPLARQNGARIIEINPDDTPLSALADLSLRGAAGDLLPKLLQ
jgi:NAD-dependent deacetylase